MSSALGGFEDIMPQPFQSVFERLRDILRKHASDFSVRKDTAEHYALEAPVGPTTHQRPGCSSHSHALAKPTPVASPKLVTVATVPSELPHTAVELKFCVVPSE